MWYWQNESLSCHIQTRYNVLGGQEWISEACENVRELVKISHIVVQNSYLIFGGAALCIMKSDNCI